MNPNISCDKFYDYLLVINDQNVYFFHLQKKLEQNCLSSSQNVISRKRLGITWTTIHSRVHYVSS